MKHYNLWFILLSIVTLLCSCSSSSRTNGPSSPDLTRQGTYDNKELTLASIIVLPTRHTLKPNDYNQDEITSLNKGATALTDALGSYFQNDPAVRILSQSQADGYRGSFIGNQLQEARFIGMNANADAVLISEIYRFRELDGKEYGANSPASVSFDYQLIHLESGMTLCKGSFEETQQPLLSNLFDFGKASKRNFKFVTAATLLKEGITAKFSQCSHLGH